MTQRPLNQQMTLIKEQMLVWKLLEMGFIVRIINTMISMVQLKSVHNNSKHTRSVRMDKAISTVGHIMNMREVVGAVLMDL
jgi:hypothetical protein